MSDNQQILDATCRECGCNKAQAIDDARVLGFEAEFASGVYSCCQLVQWADEQWLAWLEAAQQDGKDAEDVTHPLEISKPARVFVHIRAKKPQGE